MFGKHDDEHKKDEEEHKKDEAEHKKDEAHADAKKEEMKA